MFSIAGNLAAMNIVIVILCVVVAGAGIYILKYGEIDKTVIPHVKGLILYASGWALHRGYWAVNRALESSGYDFLLTSLYKSYSWVTLFPMIIIILGGGLLIEPVLKYLYGEYWFYKYLITAFLLWLCLALVL